MAYVSQELKKKLWPGVKHILDKYGLKGSLSVNNHSTLVLTIKSGKIDFIKNYNDLGLAEKANGGIYRQYWQPAKDHIDVNVYHIDKAFTGDALTCLEGLKAAMMVGHYDHSDIQIDYFNVSWYLDIKIGRWDKPYEVTK